MYNLQIHIFPFLPISYLAHNEEKGHSPFLNGDTFSRLWNPHISNFLKILIVVWAIEAS